MSNIDIYAACWTSIFFEWVSQTYLLNLSTGNTIPILVYAAARVVVAEGKKCMAKPVHRAFNNKRSERVAIIRFPILHEQLLPLMLWPREHASATYGLIHES